MNTLSVSLKGIDEKVKYSAGNSSNPPVIVDYYPPVGDGQGYTSLELLLMSFSSCISTSVLTLLRHRIKKQVKLISAEAIGEVRETHPKALSHIKVFLVLEAISLSDDDVIHALIEAANGVCPVWAMLKGNTEISVDFKINAG